MSWSEIDCSSSKSIARLAVDESSLKMAIQFNKSKKCFLYPHVPSWAVSKILRSGSTQQPGGLWNFITNAKFFRRLRTIFPEGNSTFRNEICFLTDETSDCSDYFHSSAIADEFECIDVDCSGSCGLQRMAVCYQNWAGGNVLLCVQYQTQQADACFLYSNVPLTLILQIVQSHSKCAHLKEISEHQDTTVSKLPNFPRCTDTPITVGRSSPLRFGSFQPIPQ